MLNRVASLPRVEHGREGEQAGMVSTDDGHTVLDLEQLHLDWVSNASE